MPAPNGHDQSDSGEAPEGLAEALRRMEANVAGVPPWVDLAVMEASRRAFGQRRRARFVGRGAGALAGAAAVGLVVWALWPTSAPGPTLAAQGDADGDGVVDMLDALIVSNGLRDGAAPAAWDMNGDGAVTRADVDLIAMSAVRLGAGTVAP